MFSSSIHRLPTINDFESAHEHFTQTPKPYTRKGQWNDNQRPLKDNRSHHYRIEQGRGGEYYDVMLYTTAMARFYAPTPDGRRVMYTSHDSNTSKQFMRNVTRHSTLMHMDTTDRRTVAVPVPAKDCISEDGHEFSASLWLDNSPYKRLVVEQSAHTPMYTHKVGKSDKETRDHIKALCEPYITLACMRLQGAQRDGYVNEDLLRPFKGGVSVDWTQRLAIRRITQVGDGPATQDDSNAFMTLANKVYDYEATKLYYKTHYNPEQPVTEKVLADGLWRVIVRETYALQRKSEAVQLPQFMNIMDFPRTTATPYA